MYGNTIDGFNYCDDCEEIRFFYWNYKFKKSSSALFTFLRFYVALNKKRSKQFVNISFEIKEDTSMYVWKQRSMDYCDDCEEIRDFPIGIINLRNP